jgi:hypothetical protein
MWPRRVRFLGGSDHPISTARANGKNARDVDLYAGASD